MYCNVNCNFIDDCTFIIKLIISAFCYRYFHNPKPPIDVIQDNQDQLHQCVIEGLKSKAIAQTISINFRHDVYKYIFLEKGEKAVEKNWQLLENNYFMKCNFPQDWDKVLSKNGDGNRLRFPVKVRLFLSLSPKYLWVDNNNNVVEAPRSFSEKIHVSLKLVNLPFTNNT